MNRTEAVIRPEDVEDITLEQRLCHCEKGRREFRRVENLVMGALFSRYDKRREFSQMKLSRIMRCNISLAALEYDGILYAYMKPSGHDKFTLIASYEKDSPILEEVPSEEEIEKWGAEKLIYEDNYGWL